jgi:hypothetical protein
LTRTKAHAVAEKRFAISEIADVKIDLEQEDEAVQADTTVHSPIITETAEFVQEAKQAAVTFEWVFVPLDAFDLVFIYLFVVSVFVAAYWPHFDYQLTKGLDPALVYSEFLGIIEVCNLSYLGSRDANDL